MSSLEGSFRVEVGDRYPWFSDLRGRGACDLFKEF